MYYEKGYNTIILRVCVCSITTYHPDVEKRSPVLYTFYNNKNNNNKIFAIWSKVKIRRSGNKYKSIVYNKYILVVIWEW